MGAEVCFHGKQNKKKIRPNWKEKELPVPGKLGGIGGPQLPDVEVEMIIMPMSLRCGED